MPAITAPTPSVISSICSLGTGSGTSERTTTSRPLCCGVNSAARHNRTAARGAASSSSSGAASACATFSSDCSDGLPVPDSRLVTVERGTPAAVARSCCVRPRA